MTDNDKEFPLRPVSADEEDGGPDLKDVIKGMAQAAPQESPRPQAGSDPVVSETTGPPKREQRRLYIQENSYATPEAKDQLEELKRITGKSKKELHAEALNLLFRKYNLPEVG